MSDEAEFEPEDPDHIKKLREDAKKGREADAALKAAGRKIAILEAGIPTSTALGAMFLKSYDGELTAEAIKAEAAAIGLIDAKPEPTPEPDPGRTPGTPEADYSDARKQLDGGQASPVEQPVANAVDDAYKGFDQARKSGMRTEDAQTEAALILISRAARGDKSAIFDEAAFAREADLQSRK